MKEKIKNYFKNNQHKIITVLILLVIGSVVAIIGDKFASKQNKELSNFINNINEIRYDGIIDFQYNLKFISKEIYKNNEEVYKYKGEINDLSAGEVSKENLEFYKNVYLTNNSIIEEVIGPNKSNFSIIDKKIVLKLPLKKNNSWEEEVIYEDNKYKAITKILDVFIDDGKKVVITETTIDNIKGFKDNKYREIRIYKENEGLIYFEKNEENLDDFTVSWWIDNSNFRKYLGKINASKE